MTTIIFVLELVALAVLIICGALLLLDAGSKKKQPEHKPEPQQPQRITKHPGRSKRRPTQGFKTCFICGRHLAMNRIPIVISVSGKGNRFACDKCYEKSQREKEHEKTEL